MAGEDEPYVRWIRGRPCSAKGMGGDCQGRIEAHHAGERGMGQRSHDWTCVPLCMSHHRAWHDGGAPFAAMSREERRGWVLRMTSALHDCYTAEPPFAW